MELYQATMSKEGQVIIKFLHEQLIERCNTNMNAEHIKGMGILINSLEDVERDFRKEQQKKKDKQ